MPTTKNIDQLTDRTIAVNKATDKLPLWQPTGLAGQKTVDATLADIFAETDANVTNTAAAAQAAEDLASAAQVTADAAILDAAAAQTTADTAILDAAAAQVTADAAIPASEKGVANGVATLDVSGKVPASQLTIIAAPFKGNWDAGTNTPALADGVGSAGDWYFVQNGAARNLGSGSVTWTTGALIIYNGAIWVENEAVNTVLSVNGQTGAITLTTNNVADFLNKRYVTDAYLAAMVGNDGTPSGSNKYVTESGLTAAVSGLGTTNTYNTTVTGGNNLRFADFGDGINTVGTGVIRTLSSLGYTNATAAAQWPLTAAAWGGTITASATQYDEVVMQEAFMRLKYGTLGVRKLTAGPGSFLVQRTGGIIIPSFNSSVSSNFDSQMFEFDGEMSQVRALNAVTYVFTSSIANQTEADNSCIDNRWVFKNLKIKGSGSGTAVRFGGTRSALFEQIEINNFTIGWLSGFCLNTMYSNMATVNCSDSGVKIDKGWWSGAGYANAGNQPYFMNCRFRTVGTTQKGANVIGADSTVFDRCTVEGTDGGYGIYMDLSVATVAKSATIRDLHAEIGNPNKFTNAIVGVKGANPFCIELDKVFSQTNSPDTVLIESESTQGVNAIILRNCRNNGNNDRWKLKQIDSGGASSWNIKNTTLQGQPNTAADVRDTVGYPNIWAPGSAIPTANRVIFEAPLP